MPGMSGLELARKALAMRPQLPVILVSGYSDETTTRESSELGIHSTLAKPFTVATLAAALHAALRP